MTAQHWIDVHAVTVQAGASRFAHGERVTTTGGFSGRAIRFPSQFAPDALDLYIAEARGTIAPGDEIVGADGGRAVAASAPRAAGQFLASQPNGETV